MAISLSQVSNTAYCYNRQRNTMITHYFRTVKDTGIKMVDSLRAGVWTHVVAPTAEELRQLVRELALDEAILEDAKDFFEVPRMERSQGATYFFTRYPYREQEEDIDTAPLLLVVGESFVLTLAQREVPCFAPFIDGTEIVHTTQKAKLFIQFMSAVTKEFETKLVRLRRAVQRDRAKLRSIGPREIARFVQYEHELNDMVAAVVPTNGWLTQVTGGGYMQLYNEDIELIEDLMIANNQVVDSAKTMLRTIQNIRSASEAIMTSRLNQSLSILTVLTILLTVPLVVASLYGMNVKLPLQEHSAAFVIIVVFNVFVLAILAVVFRKKQWF